MSFRFSFSSSFSSFSIIKMLKIFLPPSFVCTSHPFILVWSGRECFFFFLFFIIVVLAPLIKITLTSFSDSTTTRKLTSSLSLSLSYCCLNTQHNLQLILFHVSFHKMFVKFHSQCSRMLLLLLLLQ